MKIGKRDIWGFNGTYIDINTGENATAEEISIYKEKMNNTELYCEWHLKYDVAINDFFGYRDKKIAE